MTLAPLMRALLCASLLIPASQAAAAPLSERDRSELIRGVDARGPELSDAAMKIWGFAEMGYQETRSSALLQDQLKAAGYQMDYQEHDGGHEFEPALMSRALNM